MLRTLTAALVGLIVVAGALGATNRPLGQQFPAVGVLTPGVSLAGVHIGDTATQVVARWGSDYKVCPKTQCKGNDVVWFYIYTRGEPLGAGVRFSKTGKAIAVFTLGSPPGWKTHEGLQIGDAVDDAYRIYGNNLAWSVCVGYAAISMRNAVTVTSIYTTGDNVYGFAITAPGVPICQ